MVEELADKDENAVLFAYTECLCQIVEYYRDQKKLLPSNKELLRLFRIAVEKFNEELSEYRK